jgi:hypothetical protein
MGTTRRDFIAGAVTVASAAATGDVVHAEEHVHQDVPSDVALRVKSLESLLVEKGLVDRAAIDALIDTYEHKIGPRNGARVIARAWIDPEYKQRLLANGTAAFAELGYPMDRGANIRALENTSKVHNVVVCTLCSCYPWDVIWPSAHLVQVGTLSVAGCDRPSRRVTRVRDRTAGGRRGSGLGQHGR